MSKYPIIQPNLACLYLVEMALFATDSKASYDKLFIVIKIKILKFVEMSKNDRIFLIFACLYFGESCAKSRI
jgi:hypothetical protein